MNQPSSVALSDADMLATLSQLPTRLPPATSAWNGHIPFMFLLFKLARPRTYVELGVHYGTSFLAACDAAKRNATNTRCYGIDTWRGDPHAGYYDGDPIHDELCSHVAGSYSSCALIRSTFDEALIRFEDRSIDVLHIDGLHSYEEVSHDFYSWLPKLSDRSIVLVHDIEVRERGFEVWKFWVELRDRYAHLEFRHSHGLGVLLTGTKADDFRDFVEQLTSDTEKLAHFKKACESAAALLPPRLRARYHVDVALTSGSAEGAQHHSPARNAACPCGSGLKYKHCHGRLS